MVAIEKKQKGINQFALRIIGIAATCVWCLGHVIDMSILSMAGWVAYPIFAFMLTDGLNHTVSKGKYALRLLVFAAVSELFYDLLVFDSIDMSSQNPLFTLLIGFLAICGLDWVRNRFDNYFVTLLAIIILVIAGNTICNILCTEYAALGVFFVILFNISDKVSYPVLLEVLSIVYISFYLSKDVVSTVNVFGIQYDICMQLAALISLIFIHIYNGNRGCNSIKLKIVFYVFYPAVLLLFYLISLVM